MLFLSKKLTILCISMLFLNACGFAYPTIEFRKKESLLTKEIQHSSKPQKFYLKRGHLYYENGMYEESIKDFKSSLSYNIYDTNAYLYLGIIYIKLDELELAKEYFKKSLKIHNKNQFSHGAMANIYEFEENYVIALKHINIAIRLSVKKDMTSLYNRRARIYKKMGKKKLALKDYQKAQSLGKFWSVSIEENIDQLKKDLAND